MADFSQILSLPPQPGSATAQDSPDAQSAVIRSRQQAQADAGLQLEQGRALMEQTRNQQQATQVGRTLAGQGAASDAAQWAGSPEYAGQSWATAPAEAKQHFMDAWGSTPQGGTGVADQLPSIWNEAARNATGNPNIGFEGLQPGQTAQVKTEGGTVSIGKPPKYQTDPQTGRLYQIDPQTGEPSYVQIQDAGAQGPTGEPALSGDDFLQSIDPSTAGNIKAIAEGRQNINVYPRQQQPRILSLVQQYDPTADASTRTKRAAVMRDFTSGKSANAIRAADTSIAHLNELNDLIPKLGNSGTPWVNTPLNAVRSLTSGDFNTNQHAFNETANLLSEELAKFYGSPTIPAVAHIKESFSPNLPPATLKSNVVQAVKLLGDQMQNYRGQYEAAMGQKQNIPFLTDKSRQILQGLGIDPNTVDSGAPASAAPSAAPPPKPSGSQPPPVRMQAPDGTILLVPAQNAAEAQKRGAKPI